MDKPLTGKQGQRYFNYKDYYELWTDEIFQLLPGTTYYLGLHRPTIKDYSGQIGLVDELQKTAVDCNRGLYIHSEYD